MFATRVFQLLILAVAVLCVAQGSWWEENRIPHRAMIRRQDDNDPPSTPSAVPSSVPGDDGDDDNNDNTSSAPPPAGETSSAPPPSEETSSAPPPAESTQPPASTTQDPQSSSSEAPSRSSSSQAEITSSAAITSSVTSEAPQVTSASTQDSQSEDNNSSTETSASPVVSTSTEVVTKTNSDGTKETLTNISTHTSPPGLTGDKDSASSGMSTKTRNTIIGVVVGIGGTVVLGALALVAWRIWGRKKQAEENDGLMAYDTSYAGGERKSEAGTSPSVVSGSQRNPFQSTLENYHQPAHVNASSNF